MENICKMVVTLVVALSGWSSGGVQAANEIKAISKQDIAALLKSGELHAAYMLSQEDMARLAPKLAQDFKQSDFGKDNRAVALVFRDNHDVPVGAYAGMGTGAIIILFGLGAFAYGCHAESGLIIGSSAAMIGVGAIVNVIMAKMFFSL